jgi:hypothetical protein
MNRKLVIAAVLVAILLVLSIEINFVKDERCSGLVLWNSDEAYFFVGTAALGYRLRVLDYALEPVRQYFYAPTPATDNTSTLTVIRVTPAGLEHYEPRSSLSLSKVTPLSNGIYADCGAGPCKWTGTDFQLISEAERKEIGDKGQLTSDDFSNVDGWSRRRFWGSPVGQRLQPYAFSLSMKNGAKLTVSGGNPVAIDLQRPGRSAENVWYHKQETRMVSLEKYERTFRRH